MQYSDDAMNKAVFVFVLNIEIILLVMVLL
jgi:hypothetical protein